VRLGRSAARTDPGRKRLRNEDAFVLAPPLFAVADGMGGAQAGEVASKLAAAALEETDPGALGGEERIVSLVNEANRRVHERSNSDPATSGMGTTMTVALVEGSHVAFGHVGDSRAYLFRDGKIEQLTEDHSLVNELLKSGKLSPKEADRHPQRSVITRAVGTDPDVDVDTFTIEAKEGDVFLLCSDGLTDMVDDEAIHATLQKSREDLEQAARTLVEAANRGGGEDNITVVAFEMAPGEDDDGEETVQMQAAGAGAEDEDTLSGIDAVPAVDTMVVPAEEIPEIAEQRKRAQGARIRLAVAMLLLVVIAAALVVWGLLR
jgi:PPM family protein phosphatase